MYIVTRIAHSMLIRVIDDIDIMVFNLKRDSFVQRKERF